MVGITRKKAGDEYCEVVVQVATEMLLRGSSRMRRESPVWFLGGGGAVNVSRLPDLMKPVVSSTVPQTCGAGTAFGELGYHLNNILILRKYRVKALFYYSIFKNESQPFNQFYTVNF